MSKPKDNVRWWEYYAFRYALGVGTGTPLLGALLYGYSTHYSLSLQPNSPFDSTISAVLWGVVGIAFCYIASVPMLTLHAVRNSLKASRSWRVILFIVITFGMGGSLWLDLCCSSRVRMLAIFGGITLAAIVVCQLAFVGASLARRGENAEFYFDLGRRRTRVHEYVESYRHLREHGNSVAIVICELLLAFILWTLKPQDNHSSPELLIARISVLLGVWLAPSGLVWFLGSSLERHLVRTPVDMLPEEEKI